MNYTKIFLNIFLFTLTVSALLAIYTVLFGNFGSVEMKILATTFLFGFYSLLALGSATAFHKKNLRIVSILGFIACAISVFIGELFILEIIDIPFLQPGNESLFKLFFIFSIFAIAFSYISLLFLIKKDTRLIHFARNMTILFICLISFLFILLIFTEDISEIQLKIIIVSSVLSILGTISLPILSKISSSDVK